VTVDESVGASKCSKLDGTKSYNSVSQTNMESRLLRIAGKTREIALSTDDLIAEILVARTVVGSSPAESKVYLSPLGEGYSAQNEMDMSCVSVSCFGGEELG